MTENNRKPAVSVVMAAYNAEAHLAAAVESMLNQTIGDLELTVVNDGSTDATADILARYAQRDERVKVIHQDNAGLAAARNVAIAHSRADFVAIMDGDDISCPQRLEKQLSLYMKAYASSLDAQARYQKWRRCKDDYLKECFRDGSEIAVHKSWRQVAVWMRMYHCTDLSSFLLNSDAWIESGEMLKGGSSTTVVRAKIGGVIIKRYNRKTLLRGLRHCLRTTKAHACWRNAHLLKISGIATPRPIAFVEKRWGHSG